MYKVTGIRLKGVVCFKDVFLEVGKHPLTFVRGQNLDADPVNPTSNGVGKSLMFSCPSNIWYSALPSSTRKNTKKDILSKGAENCVHYTAPSGDTYEVSQTYKGYKIVENGVDLDVKTIPAAERLIKKTFPIQEIDYYTYVYMSTQRPYLMQTDSDINRLEHLLAIFRLDNYDRMKDFFLKKLSTIKSNEVRLSVLEQKRLETRASVKKVELGLSKLTSRDELKEKQEHLDVELRALTKREFGLNSTLDKLTTLRKIETELDVLRDRYDHEHTPQTMRAKLVVERKIARQWFAYEDAYSAYKSTVRSAKEKLQEIKVPKESEAEISEGLETVTVKIRKIKQKIKGLEQAQDEYDRKSKRVDELLGEFKSYKMKRKEIDIGADYEADLAQCSTALRLKPLLSHGKHDKKSKCPTCLSTLDLVNIKKTVEQAEKNYEKFTDLRNAQRSLLDLIKAEKQLSSSDHDPSHLQDAKKRLAALEDKFTVLQKHSHVWERYKDLKETLDSIEVPTAPERRPRLSMSVDELDEQIELCSEIEKHLEAKSRLLESAKELSACRSVKVVDKEIKEVTKKLKTVTSKVSSARAELSNIVTVLERYSMLSTELDMLARQLEQQDAEINELLPSIKDKQVVETLVKAYGSKGLKTIVANEICTLLENNLNVYRDLVFAEPFSFSVSSSETGLSLKVDRGNGHVSDVRSLSGGESNSFRLLFLLSILVLIPSDRRLNLVVLDEPSSHQDEPPRLLFLERYLPVLQEVVPNIFVITPNKGDYCKDSAELIITKQNGVSTASYSI